MKKIAKYILITFILILFIGSAQAAIHPRDMEYAYLETENFYFPLNEEVKVDIVMSESSEGYKFTYLLLKITGLNEEGKRTTDTVEYVKDSKEPSFSFKIKEEGYYMVSAEIMNKDFQSLKLSTEMIEAAPRSDENDPTTVVGKVKALVEESKLQNLQNDFEKAIWFHDWLIYNADYDESMEEHYPRGVLLDGSGVCESYAIAYQMLLKEAGIPSMYVTGYGKGEFHAWNIVKLDEDWYHVDCTWDDPKGGGNEGYGYFGLSDDFMGRDHDWERQNYLFPKAKGTKYNYLIYNGFTQFNSEAELYEVLDTALKSQESPINLFYTGNEKYFDLSYTLESWLKSNYEKYLIKTYTFKPTGFSAVINAEFKSAEGVLYFTSDEDLAKVAGEAMQRKEVTLKLVYSGDDKYYYINTPLRKFLESGTRKYGVSTYSYQYYDKSAEVTLEYVDLEQYKTFSTDEELLKILNDAASNKETSIKLAYIGEDSWYNIGTKISSWFYGDNKVVKGFETDTGGFFITLTLKY
ncbi:MAG: hypothetical protein GYA87_05560 [Christensenellaceae bacterium]|nr:hypothetical protein [Christensenellaceae bacterium]